MSYGMLILAIIGSLFCLEGIILSFLYPPIPYGLLISAFFALISIMLSECLKTYMLIEKMEIKAMVYLALFIFETLYFLILALSVLIYLSLVQKGEYKLNSKLKSFIIEGDSLTLNDISWINLLFYFGNTFIFGFYARQFYRMFWVNSLVHIYRYLKKKITNQNQTITSGLPVFHLTEQLRGTNCCLCLQGYEDQQQLTKLPCSHIFHRFCIRLWIIRSNACPLCRKRAIFS